VITIGRPFDAADHPVFESQLIADQKPSSDKKYIAFAGIAIPDKFKNTLLDLGYVLKGWFPFPDHHPYSKSDIQKLTQTDGHLITTEKDYVRLPSKFKNQIETLPVHIQIIDPNRLIEFIKNRLKP
jgi:tetraacyldisaccharide 4'-kinase